MASKPFFHWQFTIKAGLILVAALFAFYGGYLLRENSSTSGDWPSTAATILVSEIGTEERYMGRGGNTAICYKANITYEYKSTLGPLLNTDISYGGTPCKTGKRGMKRAKALLAEYPPGSQTDVYYNPENPRRSCLKPGKTKDGIVLFIFGGIILLWLIIYVGGRALEQSAGIGDFSDK